MKTYSYSEVLNDVDANIECYDASRRGCLNFRILPNTKSKHWKYRVGTEGAVDLRWCDEFRDIENRAIIMGRANKWLADPNQHYNSWLRYISSFKEIHQESDGMLLNSGTAEIWLPEEGYNFSRTRLKFNPVDGMEFVIYDDSGDAWNSRVLCQDEKLRNELYPRRVIKDDPDNFVLDSLNVETKVGDTCAAILYHTTVGSGATQHFGKINRISDDGKVFFTTIGMAGHVSIERQIKYPNQQLIKITDDLMNTLIQYRLAN